MHGKRAQYSSRGKAETAVLLTTCTKQCVWDDPSKDPALAQRLVPRSLMSDELSFPKPHFLHPKDLQVLFTAFRSCLLVLSTRIHLQVPVRGQEEPGRA